MAPKPWFLPAAMLAQIGVGAGGYGYVAENLGPFGYPSWMPDSTLLLFVLPFAATTWVGMIVLRHAGVADRWAMPAAMLAAFVALYATVFIALNTWGS